MNSTHKVESNNVNLNGRPLLYPFKILDVRSISELLLLFMILL